MGVQSRPQPATRSSVAGAESDGSTRRILIRSIGCAGAGLSTVLAQQLNMPPEHAARVLYRAPAVLLDGLPERIAAQLADVLRDAGVETDVESSDAPAPPVPIGHDVALHVEDATRLPEIAEALVRFLGCAPAEAMTMLMKPPGVVLGDVSAATVTALRNRMAALPVEVLASARDAARYDLFVLPECNDAIRRGLARDLRARGIEPLAAPGMMASGLDFDTGRAIWRRYQGGGAIRLVDRAFHRFEITLYESTRDAGSEERLAALSGMPRDVAPKVLRNLPIIIEEGVSGCDLSPRMGAYTAAGFVVEATLTTFRMHALEITGAEDPERVRSVLAGLDLLADGGTQAPLRFPYRPPVTLTDLEARTAVTTLEAAGAEVDVLDADDG